MAGVVPQGDARASKATTTQAASTPVKTMGAAVTSAETVKAEADEAVDPNHSEYEYVGVYRIVLSMHTLSTPTLTHGCTPNTSQCFSFTFFTQI